MVSFSKKEISTFWNRGYVVASEVLNADISEEALRECEDADFKPIFRKVYSKTLDSFCTQAPAPLCDAVSKIHEVVSSAVSDAHVHWEVTANSWHALKSVPVERDQAVHREFPTFETARALLKMKLVQGSIIVALMDSTRLHVYSGCFGGHADRDKRKTLILKQGSVLFFRGDLAHAGAKYDEANIRLHCYVRVVGVKQMSNSTEVVVYQTFRCDKCLLAKHTRRQLAEHRRVCSEKAVYKCPFPPCIMSYGIANSLMVHIKRKHTKEDDDRTFDEDTIEEERSAEEDDGDDSSDSESSDSGEENDETSDSNSENSSESE